jgi:2-iminobutanoate/2-iminopropanoate deaminase
MKVISANSAPAAIGPYSQAIVVDGLLFASGQIPLSPETGAVVSGGIKEQAEQVMRNIAAVLAAAGTDFSNVIKATCFLTSMDDFAAFNEVYAQYFTGKPARSCVAVSALPRGVLVEVEVIAKIPV